MIEQIHQQTGHGIRPIYQVLVVPRSSYYHASNPTPCQAADFELGDLIEAIFKRHRWRYLAVIIDLCSPRIVGLGPRRPHKHRARHRRPQASPRLAHRRAGTDIFQSDRGSQYGSCSHRQMLETSNILQSMSARANPYHNAWTASFMDTLKTEML